MPKLWQERSLLEENILNDFIFVSKPHFSRSRYIFFFSRQNKVNWVPVLPLISNKVLHARRYFRMRLPVEKKNCLADYKMVELYFWTSLPFLAQGSFILSAFVCYASSSVLTSHGRKHIRKMSSQGTRSQQMSKIRQTTLGFGVVQILLGISLTSLSFTAFTFTSSNRIRNACPYWAGFTVTSFDFVPYWVLSNMFNVLACCWFTCFRYYCIGAL